VALLLHTKTQSEPETDRFRLAVTLSQTSHRLYYYQSTMEERHLGSAATLPARVPELPEAIVRTQRRLSTMS
jgi:hypothetical protein